MTAIGPDNLPYALIGGEAGVRRLVDRFYDLMDASPEARDVRAIHATSLKASREKLFLYLSGWLGGPQLYIEKYGHPMLRARHMPFAIDGQAKDQWLWCMERAIAETEMPDELRVFLREKFRPLAEHMRNR